MTTGNGKITQRQLLFLMIGFVLGSSLLLSFMDNIMKQDTWLVVVFSFVSCLPFVASYVFLAKKLPGKNLIEINEIVFGKVLGWAISALYTGYIFMVLSFNLSDLADFYIGSVMPEMPKAIFLAVAALVAAYAVKKGIQSIARIGFLSVVYSIGTIILTFLLLIKDMNFANLLPVFAAPAHKFVQGTHIFTALPFCEVFVFLMVFPSVDDHRKLGKFTIGGLFFAALLFIVIIIRNTAVLGSASSLFAVNTYMAVQVINIGEFLTRVELLIAIGITTVLFVKICVFLYAAVAGASRLLRLESNASLLLPITALAIALALIAFESTVSHNYVAMRYHAFFPLLFSFVLPPVTLLVASIRNIGAQRTGQE